MEQRRHIAEKRREDGEVFIVLVALREKESVRTMLRHAAVFEVDAEEARAAVVPGTLPVTDGSTARQNVLPESRPYTIASKHERRRSS